MPAETVPAAEPSSQRTIRQVAADVLHLTGAAAAAQLVALAASPLLSRLYNPADFGQFAIASAIVNLFLPLVSLRYDLALTLPRKDEQAIQLLALCLLLVIGSSAGLTVLALMVPLVTHQTYLPTAEILELPLGIAVFGTNAVVMGWLIRRRSIAQMGVLRFMTVLSTVLAQIAFSRLIGGVFGLFLGLVAGYAIAIAVALRHCRHALALCLRTSSVASLKRVAIEYRAFAIFSAPSGILNVVGYDMANLLMPALYGPAVAGQSALASRVVGQPATLVGTAVNQVFWADAARLFVDAPGRLWDLFLRLNLILLVAMVPAAALTVYGDEIFGFVFGSAWRQAGTFAGVYILAQILALPIHATNCLHGYRLNSWMSAWDIGRLSIVAAAFGIAWRLSLSPLACVALFSAAGSLANLVLLGLNAAVIRRAKSEAMRPASMAALAVVKGST